MASIKRALQKDLGKALDGGTSQRAIYNVKGSVIVTMRDNEQIVSWKRNRPIDDVRVAEIQEDQNKTRHVNGVIFLAFLDNQLVCYDGQHRLFAITDMIPYVLIDIMWNADFEKIKSEFIKINSAVVVSELYTAPNIDAEIQEAITSYTAECILKWKGAIVSKNKVNRPCCTENDFQESIYSRYILFKRTYSIDQITDAIDYLNDCYLEGVKEIDPKLGNGSIEKANKLKFMLWCVPRNDAISKEDLQWALEELYQ